MVNQVDLFDDTVTETTQQGFISNNYTEVYQVIMDDKAASAFAVLALAGIPQPNIEYLIPSGQKVYVIQRVPTRVKDGTDRKWMVTIVYSNNQTSQFLRNSSGQPVTNPTEAVKAVDVEFEEFAKPIDNAKLISVTKGGPAWAAGVTVEDITGEPLADRIIQPGGIVNSACDSQPASFTDYRKRITVWRYEDEYKASYEDYLGKKNSDAITITESDDSGTKYSETFQPGRLLMKNIVKENVWRDSVLYYRIGYVMDAAKKGNVWYYSTFDEGTRQLVYAEQIDPDTGARWDADIPKFTEAVGSREIKPIEITTNDGFGNIVAIGEPQPLDGHGNPNPTKTGYGSQVWLNWDLIEEIAFGPLNL